MGVFWDNLWVTENELTSNVLQLPVTQRNDRMVVIKIRDNGEPRIQILAKTLEDKLALLSLLKLTHSKLEYHVEKEAAGVISVNQSPIMALAC